jgi:hypothetical protein
MGTDAVTAVKVMSQIGNLFEDVMGFKVVYKAFANNEFKTIDLNNYVCERSKIFSKPRRKNGNNSMSKAYNDIDDINRILSEQADNIRRCRIHTEKELGINSKENMLIAKQIWVSDASINEAIASNERIQELINNYLNTESNEREPGESDNIDNLKD